MPLASQTPSSLDELQHLTRDYARYSRSAGGLASVLGGVFCLLSYFAAGWGPMTLPWRIVLVALPLVWLLARWGMRRHYYQAAGHVGERETPAQRRTHHWCVGVTLLVAVMVTLGTWHANAGHWAAAAVGYVSMVWLLVLACWRWLRSPLEYFVGVFLFCQAALLCIGRHYPVIGTAQASESWPMTLLALMFPLAALWMIQRGVADHRRFRVLRGRLADLRRRLAS